MVTVVGIVLGVQNLTLFLIALAFVPVSGAIVWGFARPFRRKYTEILSNQDESQALLVETVSGMATVKGNAAEESGFTKVEERIMRADMRVQLEEGVIDLLTFQEVEAAVATTEAEAEIANSLVIESRLLLALLTGEPF